MLKAHVWSIEGPWSGRLGIVPRPRGGDWLDDEVQSWRTTGVDSVVSLLTPDEVVEFDLEKEAEACQNHGIEFMCFPIPDRGVPASRQEASAFLKRICQFLAAGQSVAVHCRQGIGRSGLIAGSLLILCGVTPEDAISRISQARGCVVPETAEQQEWLVGFRAASLRVVGEAVAQRMKD